MLSDNILHFSYSSSTFGSTSKVSNNRRNPFDSDTNNSSTKDSSVSSSFSQSSNENNLFVTDHFDQPLAYCDKRSSIEDLTMAIKECKHKILKLVDNKESKDKFIERLIELNEALHTAKETAKERQEPEVISLGYLHSDKHAVHIAGHKFIKSRQGIKSKYYCEVCHRIIKIGRSVYRCDECEMYLHSSTNCLQGLHRACPASDLGHPSMFLSQIMSPRRFSSADSSLHIDIESYPMTGRLTSQKFLCAECSFPLKSISSTDALTVHRSSPKFCHYYRKFYCYSCHWDDKFIIPSVYFMVNKWKKMSVCRSAYFKLKYMWNRALFRMPLFWEQNNLTIGNVLIIRKKLFHLRQFINECQSLMKISEGSAPWLIEQPYLVTMQFVEDVCDGSGLETVQTLYSNIVAHVAQCQVCQRLCDPCHLCHVAETLHVMMRTVWTCSSCSLTCIHEHCALTLYKDKSEYVCPNCSKD